MLVPCGSSLRERVSTRGASRLWRGRKERGSREREIRWLLGCGCRSGGRGRVQPRQPDAGPGRHRAADPGRAAVVRQVGTGRHQARRPADWPQTRSRRIRGQTRSTEDVAAQRTRTRRPAAGADRSGGQRRRDDCHERRLRKARRIRQRVRSARQRIGADQLSRGCGRGEYHRDVPGSGRGRWGGAVECRPDSRHRRPARPRTAGGRSRRRVEEPAAAGPRFHGMGDWPS